MTYAIVGRPQFGKRICFQPMVNDDSIGSYANLKTTDQVIRFWDQLHNCLFVPASSNGC